MYARFVRFICISHVAAQIISHLKPQAVESYVTSMIRSV